MLIYSPGLTYSITLSLLEKTYLQFILIKKVTIFKPNRANFKAQMVSVCQIKGENVRIKARELKHPYEAQGILLNKRCFPMYSF